MWPLSGQEIVGACCGECSHPELSKIEISGVVSDSRKISRGCLFAAIKGDKFDGHNFVEQSLNSGASLALVSKEWFVSSTISKEVREKCLIVNDVTFALRQIAFKIRTRFSFPVIGVGGSNGKTTTKEMLAALLSSPFRVTKTTKSENGFLGMALTLTNSEHNISSAPHALVLEIGIDESGAMEQHCEIGNPDWALLTALGPEHLAGLGTWENAINEELKLFSFSPNTRRIWQGYEPELKKRFSLLRCGDTVVIPKHEVSLQNQFSLPGCNESDVRTRGVSFLMWKTKNPSGLLASVEVSWYPSQSLSTEQPAWSGEFELLLPGEHNAANFALAVATAASLGRTHRELLSGWKNFQPPAMRSRVVTLGTGCVLYDDCYNASPESMKAAFAVLQRAEWQHKPKVVILGDMLDLGDESRKWHLNLLDSLRNIGNIHLCLFGIAMYDVFQELIKDKDSEGRLNRKVSYLKSSEDPTRFIDEVQIPFSTAVVLVKGSRGMDLGRVVKRLEDMNR